MSGPHAADHDALAKRLAAGLAALGLSAHTELPRRALAYLDLLQQWNRVYNLTAVRDPADMLTHHLLDCLAVVRPLQQQLQRMGRGEAATVRILDVGSGGGLPGALLAMACPAWQVTCVDTVAKKAAFVAQVAAALALPNLRSVHARVEALQEAGYDVVCSRALATLADFTAWSRAALAPAGGWMAMKGRVPHDEMAALPPTIEVFHVEPLSVPGLNAERCLVWMRQRAAQST
ncbi:MAG: 16S rRNA (guanine(527)-N(7))-methyltransferase RsmG [Tepidimonas ignava]|nr:16S rRNA (guanine(527)-N(7))-methyltransferase RsmG [Tepidimonas ignava]